MTKCSRDCEDIVSDMIIHHRPMNDNQDENEEFEMLIESLLNRYSSLSRIIYELLDIQRKSKYQFRLILVYAYFVNFYSDSNKKKLQCFEGIITPTDENWKILL